MARPVKVFSSTHFSHGLGLTVLIVALFAAQALYAQTYTVVHSFTDGPDGGFPYTGLTKAGSNTFYGTACSGGGGGGTGSGVVYKIVNRNGGTVFTVLHAFSGSDGSCPQGRVIVGPDGALYGTTSAGGTPPPDHGWGTVFRLQPPPTPCRAVDCPWSETVLYRFQGQADGYDPRGDLVFDRDGNIYGTAMEGGAGGYGVVFQLHLSNGAWTANVLHSFTADHDGGWPASGVILDAAGNLYGTAVLGGQYGKGVIFELSSTGSGWTEQILHKFSGWMGDGDTPGGGLIVDRAGNLYGNTTMGGTLDAGAFYELTLSNGVWTYQTLHSFTFTQYPTAGPEATPVMDRAGNVYGTTYYNPAGHGGVFQLANGTWNQADLYVFDCSQGCEPTGSVILDDEGNLYGTTLTGGSTTGEIWKITP